MDFPAEDFGRPIVLVGYMCCGKTTLGTALASRLKCNFVDLDEYIERSQGRTVSQIFADGGEATFRRLEAEALDEVLRKTGSDTAVIALGGGTPCRPGVMDSLNRCALTVWLDADSERLVERLTLGADKRPLVAGKTSDEIRAVVAEMLERRKPFYAMASRRFDSSRLENEAQVEQSVTAFVETVLRKESLS